MMDKTMKKFVLILVGLFICIVTTSRIHAIVEDNGQYCNDSADILSPSTISQINAMGRNLERQSGAQVVVVTVETTEGLSASDYANQLFNSWGLGDKNKNNGVLILIVTEQKDYWIMQGDGIKSIVSDSFLSNVVYDYEFNDMVDYGNSYDTRIVGAYKSICSKLDYYYSISKETVQLTYPIKVFLSAIWGGIVILLAYRIKKNKKALKELEGAEILVEPKKLSVISTKKEKAPPVKKSKPKRALSERQTPPLVTPTTIIYEETPRYTPKPVVKSSTSSIRRRSSTRVSSPVSKPVSKPSSPASSSVSRSRGNGGGRSSGGGVGRH